MRNKNKLQSTYSSVSNHTFLELDQPWGGNAESFELKWCWNFDLYLRRKNEIGSWISLRHMNELKWYAIKVQSAEHFWCTEITKKQTNIQNHELYINHITTLSTDEISRQMRWGLIVESWYSWVLEYLAKWTFNSDVMVELYP